jgi:protein-S-isoprenylcysteine O-methyltransferase Ste14
LVRHPGYLGEILSIFGMSLALGSLVGLAMTVLLIPVLIKRMDNEEDMLSNEFREEYRKYMGRTNRPFLPH